MFPIKDGLANKGILAAEKNLIKSNHQNYRCLQTSLNPHTFWTNKELSNRFFAAYYIYHFEKFTHLALSSFLTTRFPKSNKIY